MLLRPSSNIRALRLGFSAFHPLGLEVCNVKAVRCNHGHHIVEKFTKFSGRFFFEMFYSSFLEFSNTTVEIWLLGDRLGTCRQFQAFQGFS